MCCSFGIIEGYVPQLKKMCSPIEDTGSNIGPLWPTKKISVSSLFVTLLQCRSKEKSILMHH